MAEMIQRRNQQRHSNQDLLPLLLIVGGGAVIGSIGFALHLTNDSVPVNPIEALIFLAEGKLMWSVWTTLVLVGEVFAALALIALVIWLWKNLSGNGKPSSRVDPAAKSLATKRDVAHLTRKGATQTAVRLGVQPDEGQKAPQPGVPIGRHLPSGQLLFSSWEDTQVDIWGPRTGKTTSRAIPAILEAPGPVLATSNKRDIVDATRGPRSDKGQVWVFDPQNVSGEEPSWWWNPLSTVVDDVTAINLAAHFAAFSQKADAQSDAFFSTAATELLAGFFLAAALDNRPITDVFLWLTTPKEAQPAILLQKHGFQLVAAEVLSHIDSPEKQRQGVYATAKNWVGCLKNHNTQKWITPQGDTDQRPQFDPHHHVRSSDTLFSLSKEGDGTAGPLVTALVAAVCDTAEKLAAGGRITPAMVVVLDEVANVCRLKHLPNQYSHYGSRGIVIAAILQSWSQGEECWGRLGMAKLWSAANVRIYGGNVAEEDFLEDLSKLIGEHDVLTTSVTHSRQGRTVTEQFRRERILDVSDLSALPKGRAIMLASGTPSALLATTPWMQGPHADAVRASIQQYDPNAKKTLEEADKALTYLTELDESGIDAELLAPKETTV
jgi:type IV secretory pathway TraG/TraD family ATPase VirD4